MRIAFTTVAAPGHLNSTTTLARRLKAGGHDAVFIAVRDTEPFVSAAQLPFIPHSEKEYPAGSVGKQHSVKCGAECVSCSSASATEHACCAHLVLAMSSFEKRNEKTLRLLAQHRSHEGVGKISRQGRLKFFPFFGARMTKSKLPRMQHLPRKILCESRCIDFISEDWVTEMMKVHADLMSPSTV
jgi:hypothetical protein